MKKTLLSPTSNGSNAFQRFFALVLLIIGGAFNANAQVSSYTFSEATGTTYSDLTTGTVIISGTYTNLAALATYSLPFTFYYNNVGYSSVTMSDNGFIVLGANAGASPALVGTVTPISGTTTNDSAISCYGAQLVGAQASAEVRYDVLGLSPNRVFVMQYKDVQRKPALTTLAGLMNMQIRLYESTGVIEMFYGNGGTAFTSSSTTPVYGQVGLRGTVNTDFNSRKNTGSVWTPTSAGLGTSATAENVQTLNTVGYAAGTRFRWTPCFTPSAASIALAGDNSTLNISWTNPNIVPAAGIDYEVRTSGAGGSGATGLFFSGNTTANTVAVPGLAIGVNYCVYIKSSCRSTWISAGCVTPICTVATLPYTQSFEGVVVTANTSNSPAPNNTLVGGYPACNSLVTTSGASMGVTNNSTLGYYGFTNKNLITTGNAAQNAWYFTQIMNFPSAGSYKLSYKYGGSREQTFFQQKMKVYFGSVASAAGMTTLLADHPDIKTSPENFSVNFTVSTPGDYYIGFNSLAAASQGYLQLDDIDVRPSTCLPPTALTSGQVASGSAVIAWTAPASSPGSGYEYYLTTTGVAPISTTLATGTTTPGNTLALLTGLTPSTTYCFWVRSACSSTDRSVWSASSCFTTTVDPVYCSPSGATFGQDPGGITNVTMGSINNTTGIETNNYGNYSSLTTNVAQGTTVNVSITYGTGFTYDTAIWVDWNNDGDFVDAGELVYNLALPTGTQPAPFIQTASFVVPALNSNSASTLGPHRIRIGGIDGPAFTGGALAPCRTGQYQAFEDYSIFVTVPPPALTLFDGTTGSNNNTICAGDNTSGTPLSLSSNPASYQVYTWTPQNGTITGNILSGTISFNPTETTTYILTASQTSGNFSSTTASYTVYVNALPTPITVSPAAPVKCQSDPPLKLEASGGVIPGFYTTVFNEDFNGATNTFTTVNNSVNGNVANSAWTTRTSPYIYGLTFNSNDNSQFYLSNSDSQGSVGTTNTELISPSFSLVGYTDATLSFWHYYRSWTSGVATVEVSIDGGTTYTVLPGTSWSTVTQGASSGFVNVVLNLSAYVGQANMKIRFKYSNAQFGWYWAIDNVKVYGSNTSFVYWDPPTGLYNDPAGLIPYTGDTRAIVYAAPAATTNYTLAADSLEGCSIYGSVTVTVVPVSAGTTSGNQTLSCSSTASNITLSGYSGTITGWQYSTSPTFASGITAIPTTAAFLDATLDIGAITSTRYYRAVVTNGTCTAYSTISGVIVTKTIWTGTWSNGAPTSASAVEFQANWPAGSGDVAACSVLVSNGAVVSFGAGETLTVQGEVKVNAGCQLNFANTASLYQVLDVSNAAGTFNGNGGVVSASNGNQGRINYTRISTPIRYLDYTYWSSPVYTQTLTAFSPNSPYIGFYKFNNVTQAWNWENPINVMAPGVGYIVRSPEYYFAIAGTQAWTGTFTGVPNSGTITTPIYGSGSQVNLIGNPYPSSFNADLFLTDPANTGVVGGTMYFWTHNTDMVSGAYNGADYATYNLSGGAAATTSGPGAIPQKWVSSGTAFFINGLANGNATFKNSMRVGGNNNIFFKSVNNQNQNVSAESDLERHRYWIDIKNDEGAFKQVLVAYVETATMGLDRLFDGEMIDVGNAITLYTKVDDKKLAIQGRTLPFDAADLVPLAYKSTIASTFTITMPQFDGLFTEQHVYLEDTVLNVIHDLTESDYVFATEAGTFESRFVLRYNNGTLGTAQPTFDEQSVVVYRNAAGLHINTGAIAMSKVVIFDIRGREIASQNSIGANQTTFAGLPETHQVLLVKITGENGKTVTKKVVY